MAYKNSNSLLYKYIWKLIGQECQKNEKLADMPVEMKDQFCKDIKKNTILIFSAITVSLIFLFILFTYVMLLTQEENTFTKWYVDTLLSKNGVEQSELGRSMSGTKGLVVRILLPILPGIIMVTIPLVLLLRGIAKMLVRRKINKVLKLI